MDPAPARASSAARAAHRRSPSGSGGDDDNGTTADAQRYPSPAPSPRSGLRLSLHLTSGKFDKSSHWSFASSSSSLSSLPSSSSSSVPTASRIYARRDQDQLHLCTSPLSPQSCIDGCERDGDETGCGPTNDNEDGSDRTGKTSPLKASQRNSYGLPRSSKQQLASCRCLCTCSSPSSSSAPLTPLSQRPQSQLPSPSASSPTATDTIGTPFAITSASNSSAVAAAAAAMSTVDAFTDAFRALDVSSQLTLLNNLINNCSTSQLTFLSNTIAPRLKRDFLHDLPLELAHHVLSFVDDPKSLTRISQVSRYWRRLVESVDWVWRAQCIKHFGPSPCSTLPSRATFRLARTTSLLHAQTKTLSQETLTGSTLAPPQAPTSSTRALVSASLRSSSSQLSSSNTPPSWRHSYPLSSLTGSSSVNTASVLEAMLLENQGSLTTATRAIPPGPTTTSYFSSLISTSTTTQSPPAEGQSSTEQQQQQRQLASQVRTRWSSPLMGRVESYKTYFRRRYMINRNWIQGHQSMISYTAPGAGVVTALQFDHDHIVVGCDNSWIQIFDTPTGELLRTLRGHTLGVWALEFSKDVDMVTGEKILVSGGCDREVRVWDMHTGQCRQVMLGHTGTIRCLKIYNRRYAITGSRDATLRVWNIYTGQSKFLLQGHRDSVRCIETHGDLLVSGSYDCTARVWSLITGECLLVLQGHFQQIYSIAFNGEYIITGSLDSTCRLWSPTTGACLATLQGHTQLVGQLQLSGDHLMTGGGDGLMYMWNLKKFECNYRVPAHDQSITSLCFDAKRIVTGGNDGAVKLWDRETGSFMRELTKTDAAIWRVAICEERVVICMQRNGRTAMEVICFDTVAPTVIDQH